MVTHQAAVNIYPYIPTSVSLCVLLTTHQGLLTELVSQLVSFYHGQEKKEEGDEERRR